MFNPRTACKDFAEKHPGAKEGLIEFSVMFTASYFGIIAALSAAAIVANKLETDLD